MQKNRVKYLYNSLFFRKLAVEGSTAQHSTAQHSTAQHSTARSLIFKNEKRACGLFVNKPHALLCYI